MKLVSWLNPLECHPARTFFFFFLKNRLNLTSGTFWRAASVLNGFWLLVTCYRIPRPPPFEAMKSCSSKVWLWLRNQVAALVLFCRGLKSFKNCLPFRGKAWNFYFSLRSLPSHFCFVIIEGFFFTPLLSSVVQHFHGFIFIFIPSLSTLLVVPPHLVLLHIPDVLSRSVVSSICSPFFPPRGLSLPVTAPHPHPPNASSLCYCHERVWTVTKTTRKM